MRDEPVAAAPAAAVTEPTGSDPRLARDQADAGWVGIPNKGRIPSEIASTAEAFGRSARRGPESGSAAASPDEADARGGNNPAGPRTGPGLAVPDIDPREAPKAGGGSARVESLLHVVDRGENFWTISRLYYGSGDYYRALWKANSQRYPNIAEIHIKDVILSTSRRGPGPVSYRTAADPPADRRPGCGGHRRRRRSRRIGGMDPARHGDGAAEVVPDDADCVAVRGVRRPAGSPRRPGGSGARAARRGGRRGPGPRP